MDIGDDAASKDRRDEREVRGCRDLFASGPTIVPAVEGKEISGSLREAVREPEFVSLLEKMAALYHASPAKFDAVRTAIQILLGSR